MLDAGIPDVIARALTMDDHAIRSSSLREGARLLHEALLASSTLAYVPEPEKK